MSRSPIHIDGDITRAETLPGYVYRDHAIFERQRESVFAHSWQMLADDSQVKVPGALHPMTMLEECIDEPIVLTRDFNDRIHVLSNVCTHRSNLVVEGSSTGGERHLRCRYHGRRFGLDGRFQFMPEFEKACGFPSERDNLPHLPMAMWGPFIFASATCAGEAPVPTSLDVLISPMRERLDWLPLHEFRFAPDRSRDYLVRANWALYCDNYLEGFHIPYVHADLTGALDYGSYRTEVFEYCNLQLGIAGEGEPVFDLPPSSPDRDGEFGERIAAYYWWLWPNTMFNFYPWGLSINIVKPLAVDRTRISFLSYVWDESKLDQGAGAALDRVEREDEAIVEAVQRGVRSRFYDSGRYSPTREQGVHHFHRLLADALNGSA